MTHPIEKIVVMPKFMQRFNKLEKIKIDLTKRRLKPLLSKDRNILNIQARFGSW